MPQYIALELQTLLDLLVKQTNEYGAMCRKGNYTGEEFTQCRQILAELQQAIKLKLEACGKKMKNLIPDFPEYIFNEPETLVIPENKSE
jgi:hypothetical protein